MQTNSMKQRLKRSERSKRKTGTGKHLKKKRRIKRNKPNFLNWYTVASKMKVYNVARNKKELKKRWLKRWSGEQQLAKRRKSRRENKKSLLNKQKDACFSSSKELWRGNRKWSTKKKSESS